MIQYKYHHTGVATKDIKLTSAFYKNIAYSQSKIVIDEIQNVKICFLSKKNSPLIELVEPINENSPVNEILKKNIDKSMTEFYDLVYQYKNDCLVAGIEYKKEYYTSEDLEPEEQIYFSLTIMPFGKATTTGISN